MTATEPTPATRPAKEDRTRTVGRLTFLDWTRGLAATIMLQGHVFHSFMTPEGRNEGPYVISQFIGGITPAIFLFLTGVTLAFLMDGLLRKNTQGHARVSAAVRRAGYLFLLAFLFRLQLWAFGYPSSPVTDLLKVDILNCMGLAIAVMAGMALLTTPQRVHAGVISGVMIASLSPLVSLIGDSPYLPSLASMYLVPNPNYFSFFPWASFVGFGIAAGSILRLVTADQMHRVMQWAAIIGFGLIISAQYFSNLPYSLYPSVDFWLNSPALIFIKTGVILVLLALAFLWTHHGAGQGFSWVRQLGTTSLLVYWVHIELVYGRWFGSWKDSLSAVQCVVISIVLIAAMVALSWARQNFTFPSLRMGSVLPAAQPPRVSGD